MHSLAAHAQDGPAQQGPPQNESAQGEANEAGGQVHEYTAVATASRLARPLQQLPATVTVLPREEIDQNPTLTSDSLLRSVPSALTFRRSTSLNGDPSAQGLNLRGVAPSGVSRTLVLLDGVPVNDPFAGSIYYRALPRLGIERVEIVPGGGSALYGSSALSGVVQLVSRSTLPRSFEADASYGLANTLALGGRVAGGNERISGAAELDWLSSSGYHVVAAADRGPIDAPAETWHGTAHGKVRIAATERLTLHAGLRVFREDLSRSTRYTSAAAELGIASLQAQYDARSKGRWDLLAFGRVATFDQQRARVDEGRTAEALAVRQHVPSHDQGGSLTWSSGDDASQAPTFALGVDARRVVGSSRERLFPPTEGPGALVGRDALGEQALVGAFAESLYQATPWLLANAALRFDWFRNYAGERRLERSMVPDERVRFDAYNQQAVSPRLGFLFEPLSALRIRTSAYRSFRAPTLNELYRPFQVGTVRTAANERLGPEYLTGGELGAEGDVLEGVTLRATGFWNALEDPIINASLPTPLPDGSMRQRRNLGRARIAGVELGLDLRLMRRMSLLLAYTFVDARVTKEGPVDGLRGKRLAQDPAHRASALFLFLDPKIVSASLQVRYTGMQYEDDLNTLPMKQYVVVDVMLAKTIVWHLQAFAAIENLLNQEYLVGRAGVDTIGTPFLARVGLRIREPS